MSRIGKQPVLLPSGVEATWNAGEITIKGPKGSLTQAVNASIAVEVDGEKKEVRFSRDSDEPEARAMHGLYRSLCNNMVEGVTKGFEKRLEVHGVGYTCAVQGSKLSVNVGYSHPLEFEIVKGLQVECPNNTTIDVRGVDKRLVGQFAAEVRQKKPSEPYKGKGIRYAGEQIRRKAGKSMASGG